MNKFIYRDCSALGNFTCARLCIASMECLCLGTQRFAENFAMDHFECGDLHRGSAWICLNRLLFSVPAFTVLEGVNVLVWARRYCAVAIQVHKSQSIDIHDIEESPTNRTGSV